MTDRDATSSFTGANLCFGVISRPAPHLYVGLNAQDADMEKVLVSGLSHYISIGEMNYAFLFVCLFFNHL